MNEQKVDMASIINMGMFDVSRIQMLSLGSTGIGDNELSMLVNFKWLSLESLNVWGNHIKNISPIKKLDLSKLFELSICWNPLGYESALYLSEQ